MQHPYGGRGAWQTRVQGWGSQALTQQVSMGCICTAWGESKPCRVLVSSHCFSGVRAKRGHPAGIFDPGAAFIAAMAQA
eukprot:2499055-Lingulodinium_polyedra.AAC.1